MDSRRGDFANPTLSHGPAWKDTARYQESPQPRAGSCDVSSFVFGHTHPRLDFLPHHTQALGQCQRFLAANLPDAQLVSVASTAAAAEVVSKQSDAAADCAAICSKICLQLFADLELLHEGIQNEHRESCLLSLVL